MNKPTSVLLLGDPHTNWIISRGINPWLGGWPDTGDSVTGNLITAKYAAVRGLPVICVGDMSTTPNSNANLGDIRYYTDSTMSWVNECTTFYNCIGNHDYDGNAVASSTYTTAYITTADKTTVNIFPHGFRNSGDPEDSWYDVTLGNVRAIFVHNIQDYTYEAGGSPTRAYPYVNSGYDTIAGGVDPMDWAGISDNTSNQRAWLRSTLSDAASKGQHILLVGHRPAYGIVEIDARRNHTEALDSNISGSYPAGYLAEVEDWCATNNQHVLFLSGDQHAFALTQPLYRGASNSSYGIIHMNMVSGANFRNGDNYDSSLHYAATYLSGDSVTHLNSVSVKTAAFKNIEFSHYLKKLACHNGLQYNIHATWYEDKLQLILFMPIWSSFKYELGVQSTAYPYAILDCWAIPIVNGKLSGLIYRDYNYLKSVNPNNRLPIRSTL